jgi:hypothetical protein
VHVGALGSEDLRIARLAVFHDVFSWRERIAGMPGDRRPLPSLRRVLRQQRLLAMSIDDTKAGGKRGKSKTRTSSKQEPRR